MKKKTSSIDVMGLMGIFVWVAVLFLRSNFHTDNSIYHFVIGILPNFGAAWCVSGIAYAFISYKTSYTIKLHRIICITVVVLALVSEVIHDQFINAPFDVYDMLITVIAQSIMYFLPVLIKDNAISDSKSEEA